MDRFPTLDLIDSLRPNRGKLAASPKAATLEREARRLVSEYWSDTVWFTGSVPAVSLDVVAGQLERLA